MKTALTIAGSDPSGGAGIQADLKTMTVNRIYAMSAVTALTVQNTAGVSRILNVPPDFLMAQLDAVFTDIRPDAVKVGMLSNAELCHAAAQRLRFYGAENIVVDPVMVSTSGHTLLSSDAVEVLAGELFPQAALITPNLPEAEALLGENISSREKMEEAARRLHARFGCAVLLKGGHLCEKGDTEDRADDLLVEKDGASRWFRGTRVKNPNTHGTGCTLSSAITANLAKGFPLETAVERAKDYVTGALSANLNLGKERGPMDHAFPLTGIYTEYYRKKGTGQ